MANTSFGKRLKIARERAGWTQAEAGKRLGITDKSLSRYENDVTFPDFDTLKQLARVYDVSNDWLLGYTDDIGHAPKDISGTSLAAPQIAKGPHGKLDQLSPESKKKAEEYIEMLLTLDQVKDEGNSVDLSKNVS